MFFAWQVINLLLIAGLKHHPQQSSTLFTNRHLYNSNAIYNLLNTRYMYMRAKGCMPRTSIDLELLRTIYTIFCYNHTMITMILNKLTQICQDSRLLTSSTKNLPIRHLLAFLLITLVTAKYLLTDIHAECTSI